MSSDTTVDYTKFEVTKFEAPKPEENDRSMGQLVSYPSYNGGSLYLQLPWVKLYTYGIPRLGEYYKTDDDRAHLRVPLDLSIPEIADFVNRIKAIDAKFSSEEYKDKLFGKKAKKYTYSPIYREGQAPEEDSDDDDTKKSKAKAAPRPPYLKVKFDLTWPDKKVKTTIFESILNTNTNKRDRKKLDVSTIDEAANALRYMSTVRPIARCVKLWAHNDKKKDPQYGLTFKLIKVEVEPAPRMGNYVSSKDIQESSAFVDSDDEDNVFNITKSAKPAAPAASSNTGALLDEESDDEQVVVQKKTVQVDSESESDEEPVIQKKTVQVESDSESDDEPKTPAPAAKKPAVKQAVVESDSEEEPAPKKAAPKKAAEKSKTKAK
jgi:hypothetical protein